MSSTYYSYDFLQQHDFLHDIGDQARHYEVTIIDNGYASIGSYRYARLSSGTNFKD